MAAVPRFKIKQTPTDVWSTRERLCLASSVMRSGDQNWMSVSRAIRPYGEPNRPPDWFSQKNCALQYSDLLEKVETPKRKRGERGEIDTPGECIVRKLTQERIEELKETIIGNIKEFYRLRNELDEVNSGEADERLKTIWSSILEERRLEESKVEKHAKWLQEREAAKQAAALEARNRKFSASSKPLTPKRNLNKSIAESDVESSEHPIADSTIPDVFIHTTVKEEPSSTFEVGNTLSSNNSFSSVIATAISSVSTAVSMPSPPVLSTHHHSPLLNTLLRSSTHVSQSTTLSSPKDSCVSSPSISSLLSSSAGATTPSSVASLLTTALSGLHDSHDASSSTTRSPVTSPSQGAPTLLKLLDMPLGAPGKLPPLPVFTSTAEVVSISSSTTTTSSNVPHTPVKEEAPVVIKTDPEDELLDIISVQDSESLIETTIDIEQLNSFEESLSVSEGETQQEKVEVKESCERIEDVTEEVVVSEICDDKKEAAAVELQQEEACEETAAEIVFAEEVVTEEVEEPSSSTGDVAPVVSTEDEVVELIDVSSTLEEVVTAITETVTTSQETVIESVQEIKTEPVEPVNDDDKEQKVDEICDEEKEATDEIMVKSEIAAENILETEAVLDVKDEANYDEESATETTIDVEEISEVKEVDKSEGSVIAEESVTADESESVNKTEEKVPRRRSRSKKWAMGISERGGRRTSGRTTAGQSTSGADETTSEVKVEQSSPEQNSAKKSSKKETVETSKPKRDSSAEEQQIAPKHPGRPRRNNPKPTTEVSSERKGKGRNRRHWRIVRQMQKEKNDEDEAGEASDKSEKTVETANKEAKETNEKEEVANCPSSEVSNIETEEESKEGVASRTILPNDSVPNSPASTSFSGDDVESIRDYKVWKKAIMLVWRSVANHKYANVFLNAVTEEMAPGYQSVVYRPMDLNTVKKSIENQTVRTTTEFQRDVLLIFQNAIMYNSSDHDVYKMAVEMQQEVIGHIQDFVATQLMVQSNSLSKSLRRETRDHALKSRESLLSIIQENESKRKRPASEGDTGVVTPKRRRTRANDE